MATSRPTSRPTSLRDIERSLGYTANDTLRAKGVAFRLKYASHRAKANARRTDKGAR
jgi:hypothetical protein